MGDIVSRNHGRIHQSTGRKDGRSKCMPLSLWWRVKRASGIDAEGITHTRTVDSRCRQQDRKPLAIKRLILRERHRLARF